MPARLTCYVPDRAAQVHVLADERTVRLGRDPSCGVVVDHRSVSRAHAEIGPDLQAPPSWTLLDLESKNGTFVDGTRASSQALAGDCWLRFGDVYCEFERLTAAQAQALQQRAVQRRATSAVLQRQVLAAPDFDSMLAETLRAAVEIAGCERGFLLLGEPGAMVVRAAIGLDSATLAGEPFSGSSGALSRALASGSAVVANDTGTAPWLRERASVVGAGIRALACVPLRDGEARIGAVYTDSRSGSARISELDIELLGAFVERMAIAIAARRAGEDLGQVAVGRKGRDEDAGVPAADA